MHAVFAMHVQNKKLDSFEFFCHAVGCKVLHRNDIAPFHRRQTTKLQDQGTSLFKILSRRYVSVSRPDFTADFSQNKNKTLKSVVLKGSSAYLGCIGCFYEIHTSSGKIGSDSTEPTHDNAVNFVRTS